MTYVDWFALTIAKKRPTPEGRLHLHFIMRACKEMWVVRSRRSHLCGTPRCRIVDIKEPES